MAQYAVVSSSPSSMLCTAQICIEKEAVFHLQQTLGEQLEGRCKIWIRGD